MSLYSRTPVAAPGRRIRRTSSTTGRRLVASLGAGAEPQGIDALYTFLALDLAGSSCAVLGTHTLPGVGLFDPAAIAGPMVFTPSGRPFGVGDTQTYYSNVLTASQVYDGFGRSRTTPGGIPYADYLTLWRVVTATRGSDRKFRYDDQIVLCVTDYDQLREAIRPGGLARPLKGYDAKLIETWSGAFEAPNYASVPGKPTYFPDSYSGVVYSVYPLG